MQALALVLAIAMSAVSAAPSPALSGPPDTLAASAIVPALRTGGYVVFFRHGITDHSARDEPNLTYADWASQRNLTEAGRDQARSIGTAFRAFAIPVGTVRSSLYCRCIETARIAFRKDEPTADLTEANGRATDVGPRVAQMLGTPPAPGTNTVLVSHAAVLRLVTRISIEEGDAAIFKPLPDGRFRLAAIVPAAAWSGLGT
jgi:broad specificity phosphatase PhoE